MDREDWIDCRWRPFDSEPKRLLMVCNENGHPSIGDSQHYRAEDWDYWQECPHPTRGGPEMFRYRHGEFIEGQWVSTVFLDDDAPLQ